MRELVCEEDFRKHVMKVAAEAKHHVSHVEAHVSAAGIPDLNLYVYGQDVWLELKVIKSGHVKMRPTQRKWHRDRAAAGGLSWVMVLDREAQSVLVVPGSVAAALATEAAAWRAAARLERVAHLPVILTRLSEEVSYEEDRLP